LIEKVNADGSCIVLDKSTNQCTTVRLGLYQSAGVWVIAAVGPGSS
jgi:hypothetical protein